MTSITVHKEKLLLLLKAWLKKICSDLHSAILSLIVLSIVVAFFGWTSGVIPKRLILTLFEILKLPTPLWATILLLIVFGLYEYRKKKGNPESSDDLPLDYKIEYFTFGDYKWKTKIYKKRFEVDKTPICNKHDLPLIYERSYRYCPETENNKCSNKIWHGDEHYKLYETAKAYIEKEIRNRK